MLMDKMKKWFLPIRALTASALDLRLGGRWTKYFLFESRLYCAAMVQYFESNSS